MSPHALSVEFNTSLFPQHRRRLQYNTKCTAILPRNNLCRTVSLKWHFNKRSSLLHFSERECISPAWPELNAAERERESDENKGKDREVNQLGCNIRFATLLMGKTEIYYEVLRHFKWCPIQKASTFASFWRRRVYWRVPFGSGTGNVIYNA